MQSPPILLTQDEINQVSGGNIFIHLLEIPHILMGLREFINFAIDRSIYGCGNIDGDDYLTQNMCSLFGYQNE